MSAVSVTALLVSLTRLPELTKQLAVEEQERLAGLGTFVEIEDLSPKSVMN